MRLWLVWCLHILSLTWKSLICEIVNLKFEKMRWICAANSWRTPPIHQFSNTRTPTTLPWWRTSDRPNNKSLHASSFCARFFGMLRLLLLTLWSSALHKNIRMKKDVSCNNVCLFRLTKFCNDFLIVCTLTRWCRIAALTVSNHFPSVSSDRTLSTSVAIHEWSSTRKAPMCKRVPSVQPKLRLESCFMNLPRMDENPCVFAFLNDALAWCCDCCLSERPQRYPRCVFFCLWRGVSSKHQVVLYSVSDLALKELRWVPQSQ